ncbi:MAG: heat-inducible transcriptional repressor HrcA [Armatimonadota bacterium]|nr:heat-inducible transcriptional repressor HrcA [Armatimonadota bacterium]MDR7421948.1 heat-inducible transcriptional repressor HrcA [Armatimonadota bacterium]MDR7453516.1 heat-inducible transcriptional repressor HrcA [Armatimonadota bacterium]MDR7456981.1 heat-inducible transcriptional repressor HrcA [Armatimonadota bacterium]MDR7496504.1 heat-inducible transcriptional repressor HrcA [Armatimonadota bacterium]
MVELDQRKRVVLRAVVEAYVRSAEPVGSEHPALLEELRVSPATIRGVLAALEEIGLLTHPHTSAGRVPTDQGYRAYVDMVVEGERLTPAERSAVRRRLGAGGEEPESLTDQAARVLASITQYASVVASPTLGAQTFASLHLLPLGERRALAVIVTDAGTLQGRAIELPDGVAADDLERLSHAVTRRLQGLRVADLTRDRLEQVTGEVSRHQHVLEALKAWLTRDLTREGRARLRVEGTRHLLREPEFRQPEAATSVLEALEEHTVLAQTLAAAPEAGVLISIGSENQAAELRACSLVAASYRVGGRPGGVVALVGPTRMRYRRAASAVRYVADRLSEALGNPA